MTSTSIQPFCRKLNVNIGCFNGKETTPRNITQRNTSMFIYKILFCLIWKSNGISYIQAKKELKQNFKVVDIVLSDKHVKSFIKYEYKPKMFNPY